MITRCTTCSTGVTRLGCAAGSRRSGIGSLMTQMSTHWRTGTWGMTWSTRCAAACAMRRAPGAARWAKAAPLAGEGDPLVVAAVTAAQAQEAVREDAAFEEGVELVLHELRQVGADGIFGLGKEGRGVLLHQPARPG